MTRPAKRGQGSVRRRPNGRWQARYTGPDGKSYTGRTDDNRPFTFVNKTDAREYLKRIDKQISAGTWEPPGGAKASAPETLAGYAETWLADRDLSPSTRKLYRHTLDKQILPDLGDLAITAITPTEVRKWHANLKTGPTQRAHAYALLRTMMGTAVTDELIPASPCRVKSAGSAKTVRKIKAASVAELEAIAQAMPERYRLMVLLAAWNAMRFGELAELRRSDVDVKAGVVHVRRGVIRGDAGRTVKGPKSEAGKRDVNIPPHLLPVVERHLAAHVLASPTALMFPARDGGHLSPSSLYSIYHPARDKAGRPDLRFHDLRHTGAVLAAATGATLAELMARLGHSTVSAAMRYQHSAQDRDKTIAEALSKLAGEATVTPITSARSAKRSTVS